MKKRTKGGWLKRSLIVLSVLVIAALAVVTTAFLCAEPQEATSCSFCQRIGDGFSQIGIYFAIVAGSALVVLKLIPPKVIFVSLIKLGVLSWGVAKINSLLHLAEMRKINGEKSYKLKDKYFLVVGYDRQTKALIMRLLARKIAPVVLITSKDVLAIRKELRGEVEKIVGKLPLAKRIVKGLASIFGFDLWERMFYVRGDLSDECTYSNLTISKAEEIYLMGDEGESGRDGIVLCASEIISKKLLTERQPMFRPVSLPDDAVMPPIKAYMQIEDVRIYSQMCTHELPMDLTLNNNPLFDLEVFNYYDSWVWKCWSEKDSKDCDGEKYLPIRFKSNAERVELFVVGSGKAMKPVVDAAITLMNYGNDTKKCYLSVVSDRAYDVLPPRDAINELPELEIKEYKMSELNRSVAEHMRRAVSDEKTAVTIVILEDDPVTVNKTYLSLPFTVRSSDVSVLLWMEMHSKRVTGKKLIKVDGDTTRIRYFGMSDILPWIESNRHEVGADVNFYYDMHQRLPKGVDTSLTEKAKKLWDSKAAFESWNCSKRWGKCSSISSAGSFKEKAAIIEGKPLTSDLQLTLLKSEHNRWWAERLLGDWRVGERNKAKRLHPNLVPFDELDDFTKDIDKINIAAMARQGFIEA